MKFATLALALAALLAAPAMAEVKIALDTPPDRDTSGTYVWANTFSTYLNEHGVAATEFEQGALGDEAERLDQVSQGLLEVSMSNVSSAGSIDGTAFGVGLPFFFEDADQLSRALYHNGMLARINKTTTRQGVRVLDFVNLGTPSGLFTTKTPIRSMEDMASLRMRALDEAQILTFQAWGGQATIVSWGEVPNALQTGVADGYQNPAFVPLMFGHTGFIKHFTDAQISPSVRVAIASEDWYQSLSNEQRGHVNDAVEAARKANKDFVISRAGILDELRAAGMEVHKLDPDARAKFRRASVPLWSKFPMPLGALDAWKAAIR